MAAPLSPAEAAVVAFVLLRGVASSKEIWAATGLTRSYLNVVLKELTRKGVLVRVDRGRYAVGKGLVEIIGGREVWESLFQALRSRQLTVGVRSF